MNRTTRQAKKEHAQQQQARARALAVARFDPAREARLAQALARPDLDPQKRIAARIEKPGLTPSARDLLRVVAERAPRLLEGPYAYALEQVAAAPRLRPIDAWYPKGKGRDGLFRSLVTHALAAYPTPAIVWTAFTHDRDLVPLAVWLASGGSFVAFAKSRLGIPLTRKMCHLALEPPYDTTLLEAIRVAQVVAFGGSIAVATAFARTRHARAIGRAPVEAFLQAVAEWLAGRDVAPSEVGTLVDFVVARHAEDASYSLKGRTPQSLAAAAHQWHRELGALRNVPHVRFRPSGLRPITVERPRAPHDPTKVVWRVEELMDTRALYDEGRRMGHCVASYAHAVVSGAISIWVMTMENGEGPTGRWAQLTIEVRHANRAIVQARGRFNRLPTTEERAILSRFAATNTLSVTC